MANFRTIIDSRRTGLPTAWSYYTMFPREPSPAGDMTIESHTTALLDATMSLDAVLDEMLTVANGGVVLLICHGSYGPLMPLVAGKTDQFDAQAYKHLMKTERIEDRVREIRKKSGAAELNAWRELLKDLGYEVPADLTVKKAEETFSNDWLAKRATSLRISVSEMRRLISKAKQVRKKRLERLELRACNGGGGTDGLKVARVFFGAKSCLGVKGAGTFYIAGIRLASSRNPNLDRALNHRVPNAVGSRTRYLLNNQIAFRLFDLGNYDYRMAGAVRARLVRRAPGTAARSQNRPVVEKFIQLFVMSAGRYTSGSLSLAGFYQPGGLAGKTYVFPNEEEYLDAIVEVSNATAMAS